MPTQYSIIAYWWWFSQTESVDEKPREQMAKLQLVSQFQNNQLLEWQLQQLSCNNHKKNNYLEEFQWRTQNNKTAETCFAMPCQWFFNVAK